MKQNHMEKESKADWYEEEQYLQDTLKVIAENIHNYEAQTSQMQEDIQEMLDHYHDNDVELYTALNNTITMRDNMKKALLRNRKAGRKPYFGRIIFHDEKLDKEETLYIGRGGISRDATSQVVIDWRAPVANAYYENGLGKCSYPAPDGNVFPIELKGKRTYEIENGKLLDYFDTEVIANDDLLTKYLAKNKQAVLGEIIATIQKEQNEIIRKSPYHNMIVQGVAGSGKTTVAMHRISFILYNYQERFKPEDFYIVGSNRILLEYITGVLPDLDVYGIRQMTMEQLLVRLLYEEWDDKKYRIKEHAAMAADGSIRGTWSWFCELEDYCKNLEKSSISTENIYLNPKQFVEGFKNGKTGIYDETAGKKINPADLVEIVNGKDAGNYIQQNPALSIQSKINMLNERLMVKLQDEFLKNPIKYTREEKKAIRKAYRGRYGKNVWKQSVFELYQDFLIRQSAKGYPTEVPEDEFDVYDLAALAYLYKRVKETEVISEAHHVVIDEAQDFGMMVYAVLKACIKDCTYTIMGDVSQNIHFGYGLNDWEELKNLMLCKEKDYFGVLKKSYRNTVEIAEFAMNILSHGAITSYAAEPIIRHGNNVIVEEVRGRRELIKQTAAVCRTWQEKGLDTIAVICRNEKAAARTARDLATLINVAESDLQKAVFGSGIMVLPVSYTKGLEFDAVLLLDPDNEDYPLDEGHAKLLYVAATRALHELCVLHIGDLTGLITEPAAEIKIPAPVIEESLREPMVQSVPVKEAEKPELGMLQTRKKAVAALKKQKTAASYPRTVLLTGVGVKEREKIVLNTTASKLEKMIAVSKPALEADPKRTQRKRNNTFASNPTPEFGDMPSANLLNPGGHAKIDLAVKWAYKKPDGLYLQSRYGMLRLSPVTGEIIRVTFAVSGQIKETVHERIAVQRNEKRWMYKDTVSMIELSTEHLILHIDKKTGAVSYKNSKGQLLLSEKASAPRRVSEDRMGQYKSWVFWDWKKEQLYSFGPAPKEALQITGKAYYISDTKEGNTLPVLLSDKGYGLVMATSKPVICCNIPTYGSYVMTEEEQLDFYFVTGKNQKAVAENCRKLCLE